MRLYAEYQFRDNNGGKALTRINLPVGAYASPALLPGLSAIADAYIQALDCHLLNCKLYLRRKPATLHTPGPDTDVYQAAVLLYRDQDVYGSIEVRSPLPAVFDQSGVYAGVRISANGSEPPPVLLQLHGLLSETVLPTTGAPFPVVFLVGGRTSQ